MVLALRGVRDRRELEMKNAATLAWLQGQLSQIDLRQYPKLEDIIGDGKKAETPEMKAEEAAANARAWVAGIRGMNRAG